VEDHPFLVTEYLPNGALSGVLHKKTEPLQWPLRIRLCLDAATGLGFLHDGELNEQDLPTIKEFELSPHRVHVLLLLRAHVLGAVRG
jgi:hypothetical protein